MSEAMDRRVDILGVGVRAQTMEQAVDAVAEWIERRTPVYVCVTGVHGVIECRNDPELRRIHNEAGMTTTDGMPLVWWCRLAGRRDAERVYGPDLMLAVCGRSAHRGWRHYLYGADEATLARLESNLAARFPGLAVVGRHAPPFRPLTESEDAAVVADIAACGADIVWVGLGAPKQERWMAAHLGRLAAPVMIGVGAAFDFHAGTKPQAPPWMRRSGLEWLFRMMCEPRRLGPRYLVANTRFIAGALGRILGAR